MLESIIGLFKQHENPQVCEEQPSSAPTRHDFIAVGYKTKKGDGWMVDWREDNSPSYGKVPNRHLNWSTKDGQRDKPENLFLSNAEVEDMKAASDKGFTLSDDGKRFIAFVSGVYDEKVEFFPPTNSFYQKCSHVECLGSSTLNNCDYTYDDALAIAGWGQTPRSKRQNKEQEIQIRRERVNTDLIDEMYCGMSDMQME